MKKWYLDNLILGKKLVLNKSTVYIELYDIHILSVLTDSRFNVWDSVLKYCVSKNQENLY